MELSDYSEMLLRGANDNLQKIGKEMQDRVRDNPHCDEGTKDLMAKLTKSLFRLDTQIQAIVEEARRQYFEDDDDFDNEDDGDDFDDEDDGNEQRPREDPA